MKNAILLVALCAAFITASAQEWPKNSIIPSTIGLHIASRHANTAAPVPGNRGWNDENIGIFAGWDVGSSQTLGLQLHHQIIAGGFNNSLFERSLYAGLDTTSERLHTPLGSFGAALSITAASGYDRMTGNYTAGSPVPAGQRIRTRCTAASGCRDVLTKPTIIAAIAPGVDFSPAFSPKMTLRLSYLHDAGVGSKAVHLSSRWSF